MTAAVPAVQTVGLGKRYGPVVAIEAVDLAAEKPPLDFASKDVDRPVSTQSGL